jgi:SAM-dependent methyltransferase
MIDDARQQWIRWGEEDPWFGVLAEPRFRGGAGRDEFFRRGEQHMAVMLDDCRRLRLIDDLSRARVLEFGCGVGRLLAPLAGRCGRLVGIDIAPGMLSRAGEVLPAGTADLRLATAADPLPVAPDERFDLVFSHIVLQHIPPARGLALLAGLLETLEPGGVAVIQAPLRTRHRLRYLLNRVRASHQVLFDASRLLTGKFWELGRPVMQMNVYPAGRAQTVAATRGCRPVWVAVTGDGFGYLDLATWYLRKGPWEDGRGQGCGFPPGVAARGQG